MSYSKLILDPSGHVRPLPAEFLKNFPAKKKTVFQWSTFGQNPHSWVDFLMISTSKWSFAPFCFDYCIHYLGQSINQLLSILDWSIIPDVIYCILPHDHCSGLATVLLSALDILLSQFKSLRELCFSWLAIVTPRRITILFPVLIQIEMWRETILPKDSYPLQGKFELHFLPWMSPTFLCEVSGRYP